MKSIFQFFRNSPSSADDGRAFSFNASGKSWLTPLLAVIIPFAVLVFVALAVVAGLVFWIVGGVFRLFGLTRRPMPAVGAPQRGGGKRFTLFKQFSSGGQNARSNKSDDGVPASSGNSAEGKTISLERDESGTWRNR